MGPIDTPSKVLPGVNGGVNIDKAYEQSVNPVISPAQTPAALSEGVFSAELRSGVPPPRATHKRCHPTPCGKSASRLRRSARTRPCPRGWLTPLARTHARLPPPAPALLIPRMRVGV